MLSERLAPAGKRGTGAARLQQLTPGEPGDEVDPVLAASPAGRRTIASDASVGR